MVSRQNIEEESFWRQNLNRDIWWRSRVQGRKILSLSARESKQCILHLGTVYWKGRHLIRLFFNSRLTINWYLSKAERRFRSWIRLTPIRFFCDFLLYYNMFGLRATSSVYGAHLGQSFRFTVSGVHWDYCDYMRSIQNRKGNMKTCHLFLVRLCGDFNWGREQFFSIFKIN